MSEHLFPRTAARVRTATEELDDALRAFIGRLDAASFDVTDWEAQFIEDLLRSPRPLDEGQRTAVREMQAKYGELR